MADIMLNGNGVSIGAIHFPDRKNASLVVQRGNVGIVVGTFRNEEAVKEFEKGLKELLGGADNG